ncbi:hypothetical protein E4U22_004952 [Claviceps purpurea]|nr:hypothetical protein E4U22_004952 [Claviceps purpurea]
MAPVVASFLHAVTSFQRDIAMPIQLLDERIQAYKIIFQRKMANKSVSNVPQLSVTSCRQKRCLRFALEEILDEPARRLVGEQSNWRVGFRRSALES